MKLLLKLFGGLMALAIALGAYVTFSHQPEAFPLGSVSEDRLQPGPWSVASYDETFVDRSRRTQANGDYSGDRKRSMQGTLWYPRDAEAGERPLLIFSHGFTSLRSNGAYLAEHLASHGFVVAAVDYPLTSMTAPGGPMVEDVVNQPGDVSFLIDTMTGFSAVAGHALSGKIDPERIGVFGISLGGLTSTLVGYHPQLRDSRVSAVVSVAGPSNFFTPAFFANNDADFMMLAGDLDALVPYADNAEPVLQKIPGAELVTVHGGSHTGFSGGLALLRAMKNTDALGCWSVMRNIDEGAESQWAGLFGAPSVGLDYDAPMQLCEVDPLPKAMNVLRQHMLARVAIRAFFESKLASDAATSRAAEAYLSSTMAEELADISYATAENSDRD
ncbi:MAG: alpha/beta hydrolase family protein [Congregibacter sp.]